MLRTTLVVCCLVWGVAAVRRQRGSGELSRHGRIDQYAASDALNASQARNCWDDLAKGYSAIIVDLDMTMYPGTMCDFPQVGHGEVGIPLLGNVHARFDPEVVKFLSRLASNGVKLAVATHGGFNAEFIEELFKLNNAPEPDVVVSGGHPGSMWFRKGCAEQVHAENEGGQVFPGYFISYRDAEGRKVYQEAYPDFLNSTSPFPEWYNFTQQLQSTATGPLADEGGANGYVIFRKEVAMAAGTFEAYTGQADLWGPHKSKQAHLQWIKDLLPSDERKILFFDDGDAYLKTARDKLGMVAMQATQLPWPVGLETFVASDEEWKGQYYVQDEKDKKWGFKVDAEATALMAKEAGVKLSEGCDV